MRRISRRTSDLLLLMVVTILWHNFFLIIRISLYVLLSFQVKQKLTDFSLSRNSAINFCFSPWGQYLMNIPLADERYRVMERKETPLFDISAFREAVINAFIHNDWLSGNEPMFTMFTDRFEILSRGTIPKGLTIEGFFKGESVPVNERLSEIGILLHISEKTGRGVL